MDFKCRFSSDCFRSCSDCLFFKKCKFCNCSSECSKRYTDKSCQFDDPLIKALFLQEKVFDLIEEDEGVSF